MGYELVEADLGPAGVRRMTFVLFLPDGSCAAVPERGGVRLPSGPVREGEHFLVDTARRVPLEQAGYRTRRVHPVACDDGDLFVWLQGDRDAGRRVNRRVGLVVGDAGLVAGWLTAAGRPVQARAVRDAAESFADQGEDSYFADCVRLLEPAYLRAGTPEGGSGFSGSAQQWRARREGVLAGVTGPGSFLDLGCANGLLMESVHAWAAERGVTLEPYGVDLSPALVALARRRLPRWADRIAVGNALTWRPADGRRFRYVHLLLDLVPAHRCADLLAHAASLLMPQGRLLVSHYLHEGSSDEPVLRKLAALGLVAGGVDPRGETAWLAAAGVPVPGGANWSGGAEPGVTSVENVKSY